MNLKKLIRNFKRGMHERRSAQYDSPLASPTAREEQLIAEFRERLRELTNQQSTAPSGSTEQWSDNVARFTTLVLESDPREFLRWDVIRRAMTVVDAPYVTPELKHLRNTPEWKTRWQSALREVSMGHPIPHWQYPESSGTLIHHAYHWATFEEMVKMPLDKVKCIFEFGGGYGGMCRLFHNLGYRQRYIMFDLPAFSALQQFFLKAIDLPVASAATFGDAENSILCASQLEQLEDVVAEHVESESALFVATWSLSESPLELRAKVLPLISSFNGFLVAYQNQFANIDNVDFFSTWSTDHQDVEWHDWQNKHIRNSRYLMGKRVG